MAHLSLPRDSLNSISSGHWVIQKKESSPFFSVSAGGKLIGDNSAVLFSNSKFNSGLNLGLKIHIPFYAPIHHGGDEADSILVKICKGNQEMTRLLNEAFSNNNDIYLSIYERQALARIDTIQAGLAIKSELFKLKLDTLNSLGREATASRLKLSTELAELLKQGKEQNELIDDLKNKAAGYRLLIDSAYRCIWRQSK